MEKRRLEKLWDRYETKVGEYCEEQFDKYVKPYCVKHDCEFYAGGGTFVSFILTRPGMMLSGKLGKLHEVCVEVDEEHPLFDILCEGIPGMLSNNVGSLMPDYRKAIKNEINKK